MSNEVSVGIDAVPGVRVGVPSGPPGFSPSASVTENEDGALISITDASGTSTAQIYNGEVTAAQFNTLSAYALAAFPTDSASGAVASFPDGADGIPVKSLTANIEPVQSGTGTPSPDNIRPISGWTGLTLNVSGADTTDPTTYEVDWTDEAGVVYGGTLDMTTGLLTVDRLGFVFDGTEPWSSQFSGDNNCFRVTIDSVKTRGAAASGAVRACSHYANAGITSGNTTIGYYAYTSGSLDSVFIQIRPDHSVIPSLALDAWKAFLAAQAAAGTPVTCWFQPLEEYYRTYQLDPVAVVTLLGQNNIWGDTGDVTVEYRADPTLYIVKKLSE